MYIYHYDLVRESKAVNYDARKTINSPNLVKELAFEIFEANNYNPEKEHFIILMFNTKNKVVGYHLVSMGGLNSTLVHPREIFRTAILHGACSIVLIHNHPSGDITPSNEDIKLTLKLEKAGNIIGIKVLDHVIIGTDDNKNSLSLKMASYF